MREALQAKRYVGLILAAGIGGSALTGCASGDIQTWQIGVECPDNTKVQIGSLDTDPYGLGDNDSQITVTCADSSGTPKTVSGMELVKGQGAIINTNKQYTNTIDIQYKDPSDGYSPQISLDALTGFVVTDNAQVQSVAVTD